MSRHQPVRTRIGVFSLAVLFTLLFPGCAPLSGSGAYASPGVGLAASYSDLNGWGGWAVHARFGEVWYPYVDPGWAPFTYGNWIWTDQGWLWSSYEPYGWQVFHYGNWYHDYELGWFWVPGSTWSPAPVIWYVYDDYVAWAPAPPRGVSWPSPWQSGVTVAWTVVARNDFLLEDVGRHRVTSIRPPSNSGNRGVARRSPDIKFVAERSPEKVQKFSVKREATRTSGRTLYRASLPSIEKEKVAKYQGKFSKGKRPNKQPQARVDEKGKGRKNGNRPPS